MLSQRATDWGLSLATPRLHTWKSYALAVLVAAGCSGAGDAAAEGEECFRAADCDEGLVCIAGQCSRDLSGIISQVEGPAGGEDASAGGAAGAAGAGGDAGESEAGVTGGSAGDAGGSATGGAAGSATGGSSNGGSNGSGTGGDTPDAASGD